MSGPLSDDGTDLRQARSVLFVCLGNICRSPLAKGVFVHAASARGVADQVRVDSCGTGGWHVGGPADPRTLAVAKRYRVPLPHCARQLDPAADFGRFDVIVPMDRANLRSLERSGCPAGKAFLFLDFASLDLADPVDRVAIESREVPDPYHGGEEGFEQMYRLIRNASDGLLNAMFPSE